MRDPNDFLSRLLTMNERWLYHYKQETKQQSMEWGIAAHPAPPQKIPSAKIRWKSQDGILLIDYLPKGHTINAEYYSSLLVLAIDGHFEGKTPTPQEGHQGVLFLHDNAPAHRALATQKKLAYLGFQCLDHPPYSPDLAPSGVPTVLWTAKQLKGRHSSSDAEVITAADTWLDGQLCEFF